MTIQKFLFLAGTAAGLLFLAAPAQAGVQIGFSPEEPAFMTGEIFTLELVVSAAGNNFNAYEITIEYDTAHLTFMQVNPTVLQEGDLMRNVCGNTFQVFDATVPGVVDLTHSLLCAGGSITGPGTLYKLKFEAGTDPVITTIAITNLRVINAGVVLGDVSWPAATELRVGDVSGVGPAGTASANLLTARPNPFRTSTVLEWANLPPGPARIEIFDLQGRRLQSFSVESLGPSAFMWQGRDARGVRVPGGVYFIRLSKAGSILNRRVIRLD